MTTPGDSLFSTADVAELLQVTPRRVRQLVEEGALEATAGNNGLVFKAEDVDAYVLNRRAKRTTRQMQAGQDFALKWFNQRQGAHDTFTVADWKESAGRNTDPLLAALTEAVDDLTREVRSLRREQMLLRNLLAHRSDVE